VHTDQSLEAALERLKAEAPRAEDIFLLTGDLAQDPTPQTYTRMMALLSGLPSTPYALPGNHDDFRLLPRESRLRLDRRIPLGNWQILCLDSTVEGSSKGLLREEELDFLEQTLHHYPDPFTLIAVHHPPIPTRSAWMDTMMIQNAEAFFERIAGHARIKAILCGHIHQSLAEVAMGIPVLGCPSTAFQFEPKSTGFSIDQKPPGFRMLELYASGEWSTRVVFGDALPPGLDLASKGY
jgi:Icc protein